MTFYCIRKYWFLFWHQNDCNMIHQSNFPQDWESYNLTSSKTHLRSGHTMLFGFLKPIGLKTQMTWNLHSLHTFNPLNPAGWFTSLCKQGSKNLTGQFSGICYGVSKTWRASKQVHVRSIINWFVCTGRYRATLWSQVESSILFSFRTTYNLLTGFCTRCTILHRKYGRDRLLIVREDTDSDTRLMLWTM